MGEAAVVTGPAGAGAESRSGLFAAPQITHERRPDGCIVLRSARGLGAVPRSLGVLLERWAVAAPDRVFLAEREASGAWRHLTYEAAARAANAIGQALLDRGLGPDRPLMILAENGIDHGLMMLGAMHVGVPVVPVSTAYARLSQDFGKLRYIFALVEPGLIYVDEADRYAKALQAIGADRDRDRGQPRQPRRDQTDALRRPDRAASYARRRCRLRARRPGDGRQDPVHLGLDRPAQGRDQHPGHAVRQSGERRRGLDVPRRSSAGDRRLAALEPHLRRQPQLQHDAAPRRQPLHRRGQAGAGPHRPHGGQPAGDLPHRLFQRAARLRGARRSPGAGRGAAADVLRPPRSAVLCGGRSAADPVGPTGGARHRRRAAARCRSSPHGGSPRRLPR